MQQFATPVLFLVFNRPDNTRQVFEAIRERKPSKLYIAADGPRPGNVSDGGKCAEVREVVQAVDWDCDVTTLFRERNLGCGRAIADAFSWFFSHEEEGIILEDDCLPSQGFFRFCSELLDRYRDDTRVMQIGGVNLLQGDQNEQEYSYFFSDLNCIWGWATWKRSWELFDFEMRHYDLAYGAGYMKHRFDTSAEDRHYKYVFSTTHAQVDTIDIWDYQWDFSRMCNSGLVALPCRNLIENLGINPDATHTREPNAIGNHLVGSEIDFPLKHPAFMMVDKITDRKVFRKFFSTPSQRFRFALKKLIPGPVLRNVALPIYRSWQLAVGSRQG